MNIILKLIYREASDVNSNRYFIQINGLRTFVREGSLSKIYLGINFVIYIFYGKIVQFDLFKINSSEHEK